MIVSELEIRNFRNFEEFQIRLKPFTLIIGSNNVARAIYSTL